MAAGPGWYDDAEDPARARWWDGERWTEHRVLKADHPNGPPPAPTSASPAAPAFAASAPGPTPTAKEARADAKAAKAREKALRPWWKKKRYLIPLGILVIVVIAAVSSGGEDDDDGGSGGSETAAETEGDDGNATEGERSRQGDELLAIGETGTTSGFEVTLLTVEHPFQVGQFEPGPDPGNRLIGVELSMRNTNNERRTMSTALGMEISDDTGQRFNITLAGLDRPQLGGEAAPGETIRGWAVFEVPEESTGLELEVRGSVTASGIRFDLGL